MLQTSTSTTTAVVTSYTALSPQPSIFPPNSSPNLLARDGLMEDDDVSNAGYGRRALAEAVVARGKKADCKPKPKPGSNKRKVVQCTPVVTKTSTATAPPKRTVTVTTTSLLPRATSVSFVTGTVTQTIIPSTTVVDVSLDRFLHELSLR